MIAAQANSEPYPPHAAPRPAPRSRRNPQSNPSENPGSARSRAAAGMESGRPLSARSTRPNSSAISTAPRPSASLSRRPTRAGSQNSPASTHAGQSLAEPVRRYEAIEDLLGRLVSYAGLIYSGNTADPTIAKFYGDVQERITAISLHLLFFTLELNRIDDRLIEQAMADPALGHYRPWIEDLRKRKALSARGPDRAIVSRKVGQRLFGLEPAVRRNDCGVAIQGRRAGACDRADAQSAAGSATRRSARPRPKRWPKPSRPIPGCFR